MSSEVLWKQYQLQEEREKEKSETTPTKPSFPNRRCLIMSEKHNVKLSKSLSWLLRHNIVQMGLTATKEGYVDVQDVLKLDREANETKYVFPPGPLCL